MALGDITTKYETGGIGTSSISNTKGDSGGASYGKFQLSFTKGSLREYMDVLKDTNPDAYNQLMPLWDSASRGKEGAFGKKWVELSNKGMLQDAEGAYATNAYIKNGLANLDDKKLATRIKNSPALQEAFLSTTVQHGATGGANVWNRANKTGISDADLIRGVYAERGRTNPNGSLAYFGKNSPEVQRAVANRFKNEVNDVLGLLENPMVSRPSVADSGFTNPAVAQSTQNSVVPTTPVSEGFVGFQDSLELPNSLLDTVNRNNTNLAGMTNRSGFSSLIPTLNTGIRYNPIGLGFGA